MPGAFYAPTEENQTLTAQERKDMETPELNTIDSNAEEISTWAYVEIMGHSQLAGRITTRKMGSAVMLQVDVPKGEKEMDHSELVSPASIFSIKPTTEAWCRRFAGMRHSFDILPYIPEELKRQLKPGGRLVAPVGAGDSQYLVVVDASLEGGFSERILEAVKFVPLLGGVS